MNVVLGDLPTWNLGDLYSSPTGTDLNGDLKRNSTIRQEKHVVNSQVIFKPDL